MSFTRLDRISIRDFRIINNLDTVPGNGINIVCGPNGAGKSSFLEAVYLTGSMRSFRLASNEVMIRKDASYGFIDADYLTEDTVVLNVKVHISKNKKVFKAGGKIPDSGHFSRIPMVLFHPGQLEIIQGSPEARRRFIDRIGVQCDPSYQYVLRDYARAMKSRNAALKNDFDPELLSAYEQKMSYLGPKISEKRKEIVEQLNTPLADKFSSITRTSSGTLSLKMIFRPDIQDEGDVDMLKIFVESRNRDRMSGRTTRGPHRDDADFLMDGMKARRYASQGQARVMVLSIKLAEYEYLGRMIGRRPILLFDDVSSELDEEKKDRIWKFLIESNAQVFLTTTEIDGIWMDLGAGVIKMGNGQERQCK